jgi:hypothetical protein
MLELIIAILVILWVLGIVSIPWLTIPDIVLFEINSHVISIRDALVFMVVLWAISVLPQAFRIVGAILAILWLLSVFGILAVGGLSNLLLLAIIIGLFLYLLGFAR